MSRQLELDINRPTWAETNFRSEVKDLWSVRTNSSFTQSKNEPVSSDKKSVTNANNTHQTNAKEL